MYSCHLLISSASVRSTSFLLFIEPIFAWNVPLVSLIFLKRSLVFPILLFSSISLHWSLRKAFLSLLDIWNAAFRGYLALCLACCRCLTHSCILLHVGVLTVISDVFLWPRLFPSIWAVETRELYTHCPQRKTKRRTRESNSYILSFKILDGFIVPKDLGNYAIRWDQLPPKPLWLFKMC